MSAFDKATIERDDAGNVRQLNHLDEPFRAPTAAAAALGIAPQDGVREGAEGVTARQLADLYLEQAIPFMNLNPAMLHSEAVAADEADRLVYHGEASVMGNTAVNYMQTIQGVPVWESGMAVQVEDAAMQVIGSQNTMRTGLTPVMPPDEARYSEDKIGPEVLIELMGLGGEDSVDINHKEPFIYQYSADHRIEGLQQGPADDTVLEPDFALPAVDDSIQEAAAYLVTAVQFTRTARNASEEGWLALIEPEHGSVLHLRSLKGCGMQVITTGDTDALPSGDGVPTVALPGTTETATVVFFDIGDTLGQPGFDALGNLQEIQLFAGVIDILAGVAAIGARIGVISDPGPFDPGLIRSLLQDTGAMAHIDDDLVFFGAKDNGAIFEAAALTAGVTGPECVFVGENTSERIIAQGAGFSTVEVPRHVFAAINPNAARALVYSRDPKTKVGNAGPAPDDSTQMLDQFRDLVALEGLTLPGAGDEQELSGEFIQLQNIDTPSPTIPTSPPPGDFSFSVNTNDFGAVNAYHNCDRLFRILEDFGIDVRDYFDGTDFPVRVDHRVRFAPCRFCTPIANIVNASAPGTRFPPGSDGFRFALAAVNTAVGMAADWRVVLHEFGHTLLWDNVGSPNFRFAHSAGDALAAILNDPGNQAARNVTFPWVGIGRSHMRPVSDFAWYGTRYEPFAGSDGSGYVAEQMLSSTLFRAYRAAGGDSDNRQEQEAAASYVVFLIIKAIRLMSTFNNPSNPEGFADLLMQADSGTMTFRDTDRQIGVLRKVIRWSFEMQGAYRQPATTVATATNRVGRPPSVDVYINDGRDGQYQYVDKTNTVDIWNRQVPDGGSVHQEPVIGRENFAFVRVSNRGLSQATNISVRGFQSPVPVDQIWPGDWAALSTPQVTSAAGISPGGELVVGPFGWTPLSQRPVVLFGVSASGDLSNLERFSQANPVTTRELTLLDNNIAMRSMATVSHPSDTAVG
ncbi:hypothetical protein [Ruegeria sp. HKCCD8929]|uniref:hypothetical protein n=1 Tax=Ruegeria sp. HKCCD8929 TaxID=2683006 RepID=UPI001489E33E|nr:hypothetical protein [Ruegeria sp. HKCCD8929]